MTQDSDRARPKPSDAGRPGEGNPDGLGNLTGTDSDPLIGKQAPDTVGTRTPGDLGGMGGQRKPGGSSRD